MILLGTSRKMTGSNSYRLLVQDNHPHPPTPSPTHPQPLPGGEQGEGGKEQKIRLLPIYAITAKAVAILQYLRTASICSEFVGANPPWLPLYMPVCVSTEQGRAGTASPKLQHASICSEFVGANPLWLPLYMPVYYSAIGSIGQLNQGFHA